MINKTQEVWVNEKFENDLNNNQSVKNKSQIVLIKIKKILINIIEIIHLKEVKKFEDAQLLEEVHNFVENT